ncbi:MAG: hypothetical protein GC157_07240 [Frankiales bacterium]|nr:hypothetical protein [Frankiales bacterium]
MASTTLGYPYPQNADSVDVPGDMQALADAIDASPGVTPMTDATISGLSAGLKRAGRAIWRSTAGRFAVFDGSSALDLAFLSDVTTHQALTATHGATGALVGTTNTQTLTNKTLTAPTVNGGQQNAAILSSPQENCQVSTTAATGTVQVDLVTAAVWYYTTSASANWTFNFRGNSGTSLDSLLAVGDSVSVVFLVTQGATAYYPTAFTVDGSAVTPKWSGGAAPSAGNASAVDAYSFTIIKTGSGTFTVLAGAGSFA